MLFKHIDVDGSRRVSFNELSRLIREQLKVSTKEMPELRLMALWKVLDENASGFIDAGELSRFMRIGRPAGGLGNRIKKVMENKATAALQRKLEAQRSGKTLLKALNTNNIVKASEAEVKELSVKFNKRLAEVRPRTRRAATTSIGCSSTWMSTIRAVSASPSSRRWSGPTC